MRSIHSLSLILLVVGVQLGQCGFLWFNRYLKSDYDKINDYLTETVDTDDVDANMAKLVEWIDDAQKPTPFKKVDNSMLKAINQLLALREVNKPEMCNRKGYEILLANDRATRDKMHIAGMEMERRIDKIVWHYYSEHRSICWPLFPDLVAAGINSLDIKYKTSIETLTNNNMYSDGKLTENNSIYVSVVQLAESQLPPKSKNGLTPDEKQRAVEIFDKYVYEPCHELNDKVGNEYLNAIWEYAVAGDTMDGFDEDEHKYEKFLTDCESLRVCYEIVEHKKLVLKHFLKQVEKFDK